MAFFRSFPNYVKPSRCRLRRLSLLTVVFTAFWVIQCLLTVDLIQTQTFRQSTTTLHHDFNVDAYFRAQNGELSLYSETVYPSTPQIQRAIHKHQNPSDCTNARYLIHEPVVVCGFGAVYFGIARSLAYAIATKRVLVVKSITKPWTLTEGCETPGPQCFFLPETRCVPPSNAMRAAFNVSSTSIDLAYGDVQVVELHSRPPYLHRVVWNHLLPDVYKNLGVSPPTSIRTTHEMWRRHSVMRVWNTQALLFLMRLNRRMQNLVRPVVAKCSSHGDARETLGVPMRGSDKCYKGNTRGEMDCLDPSTVSDHMRRVRYAQPWLHKAILTSEDVQLETRTKEALKKAWDITTVPDVRPGTGRPGEQVNRTIPPYLYTQAAITILTCQLTAGTHVLTPRSNFHSMIDLLAKVVPGRRTHFTYSMGNLRIGY